jgi:hypothetical protein
VFLHYLGALFAYWLCRDLDISTLGSLLGGFIYSFAGMFGVTLWPEVLGSMVVAPLVLLFLLRAFRRPRYRGSAAMAGLFLGLAWLSGHHEVPIYLTLLTGAVCVYELASNFGEWRRSIELLLIIVLFTVLVSGLQTVPGYEYAKLAVRWVGLDQPVSWNDPIPYRIDVENSLPPSSLMGVIVPWSTRPAEAFVGIGVLCLALIAIFTRWNERSARLLTWIAIAGLLLAFGGSNFLHGVLYAVVPLFGKARTPLRLLSVFGLGIAPLAAAGLDSLIASRHSPVVRLAYRILICLGAWILAMALAASAFQKPGPGDLLVLAGFIAIIFGCLLLALFHQAIPYFPGCCGIIALILIELGNFSGLIYRDRAAYHRETLLPKLTEYRDIAGFLRNQPGTMRVSAEAMGGFNFGEWEGIDALSGYGAGVTSNFLLLNWPSARIQNLLGVRYTLTKEGPRADQQLVFHGASGFNVLKNEGAFPRTWIVHEILQASSPKEAARILLEDPAFDARSTGILSEPGPAVEQCGREDAAEISYRTANSVVIDARLNCSGMLVLSDVWYPGWVATVDGRPTGIYQPYAALRGVVLDKGQHRVKFEYRPMSARIGALMTLFGMLGAAGVAFAERYRRSKPSATSAAGVTR